MSKVRNHVSLSPQGFKHEEDLDPLIKIKLRPTNEIHLQSHLLLFRAFPIIIMKKGEKNNGKEQE